MDWNVDLQETELLTTGTTPNNTKHPLQPLSPPSPLTHRARAARLREQQLAQQAEVAAQLQLPAQIGVNHPQIPPEPIPNNNNHAPPPVIPPPNDPLSAVSTEDRILLDNC